MPRPRFLRHVLAVALVSVTAGCASTGGAPWGPSDSSGVTTVTTTADGDESPRGAGRATHRGSSSAPSVPERLVDDAEWVERDGTRALKVTPADRLRGELDPDVVEDAWRRVVRAVPDAKGDGLRDQFRCHAMFAPDKSAWYLEPDRPEVGWWQTVAAGCNPGDVVDVG